MTDRTRVVASSPEVAPRHADLVPGTAVGEYVILHRIAAGGCGVVYLAQHRILGRRAAVKLLHAEIAAVPEGVERFIREARAVSLIGHPGIVSIFEFSYLDDGRPYYIMEHLEGETLQHAIRRRGRFSPAEALEVLEPMCDALEATHDAGVIHRDLTSSNVFLLRGEGKPIVKLLDFGIAKLSQPAATGLTTQFHQLGTPTAMAPEQFRGLPADPRTDIYAFGVLLHELATGRPPFLGSTFEELERLHLEATPPRPSQSAPVRPAFDAVVARCLQKLPARRYPSVRELRDELRRACRAREATAAPELHMLGAAIHLEARLEDAELDDDLIADAGLVFDLAAQRLRDESLILALETSTALLGVLLLSADEAEQEQQRRHVALLARSLHRELAGRPDPRLELRLTLHIDKVVVRLAPGGPVIVGGALEQVDAWAAERPGAFMTGAAARSAARFLDLLEIS